MSEAPSPLPGTRRCRGNGGGDSWGWDYYFDNWRRLGIYLKTNSVPSMNSMNPPSFRLFKNYFCYAKNVLDV